MRIPTLLTRTPVAFGAASLGFVLFVVWQCADFTAPLDSTGGLPDTVVLHPSFQADIQPIFTKRCSIGGCHSLASAQADLVLQQGYAYDSLVNHPALLVGMLRVKPGDHVNSWLWRIIGADSAGRFGLERMPFEATPLTPNQIQNIARWIDEGARRN